MTRRYGVTLVELLIAMAIMGTIVGAAFIYLPGDRIAVNQAAKALARDIQLARFHAIRVNWFVGVHIEPGEERSRYLIYCDHPDCLDPETEFDPSLSNRRYLGAGRETVLKTVRLGPRYGSLATIRSASQRNRIVFDPRGAPMGLVNQTIVLANPEGTYTREVVVSLQGHARVR